MERKRTLQVFVIESVPEPIMLSRGRCPFIRTHKLLPFISPTVIIIAHIVTKLSTAGKYDGSILFVKMKDN